MTTERITKLKTVAKLVIGITNRKNMGIHQKQIFAYERGVKQIKDLLDLVIVKHRFQTLTG